MLRMASKKYVYEATSYALQFGQFINDHEIESDLMSNVSAGRTIPSATLEVCRIKICSDLWVMT